MRSMKSKLMGGVAAIVLAGSPALAQQAAEMGEAYGPAAEMQVAEAKGQALMTEGGQELGTIEDIALQGDRFVVIVADAEGTARSLDLSELRYENDGFITGMGAEDFAAAPAADLESTRRVTSEATLGEVFQEYERRSTAEADMSADEIERQTMQTAGGQFIVEQAEPKVNVDVPDPEVDVAQKAPQVTVEQPEPTVTVTQNKPNVTVEQQAPVVTVEQSQPTVTVDIPEPVVTIQMPEPDVNVAQAQPQVQVETPEPQVRFVRPEPKIQIESAEAEVQVEEAEAQVDIAAADKPAVDVEQAQADVNVQSAGEADVKVSQADPKVAVEEAEGANVDVDQGQAVVNLEEEGQQAETDRAMAEAETDEVTESENVRADATMMADIEPRDGFERVAFDELTADALTGTNVYDLNGEMVGEISELIVNDGQIAQAVIDVGGFLGLGEKPVAMQMQNLSVQRSAELGELRVFVDQTEDSLESMPEYEG